MLNGIAYLISSLSLIGLKCVSHGEKTTKVPFLGVIFNFKSGNMSV